jgi:hypothetical protein
VANQRRVLDIDLVRPAQLNSTYMVIYFIGGSLGAASALAKPAREAERSFGVAMSKRTSATEGS